MFGIEYVYVCVWQRRMQSGTEVVSDAVVIINANIYRHNLRLNVAHFGAVRWISESGSFRQISWQKQLMKQHISQMHEMHGFDGFAKAWRFMVAHELEVNFRRHVLIISRCCDTIELNGKLGIPSQISSNFRWKIQHPRNNVQWSDKYPLVITDWAIYKRYSHNKSLHFTVAKNQSLVILWFLNLKTNPIYLIAFFSSLFLFLLAFAAESGQIKYS